MQPEDQERVRAVAIFSGLSEATLTTLTKGAFLQRFPSQTMLFRQGDLADFLYVLLEGSVQFTGTAPDARETVVEILKPVDAFMPAAVLTNTPYLVSAKVVHPARILMVPAAAVLQTIAHDAGLALAMLASIARQYRALLRQVKDLKLRTSTQRLGCYLLALAEENGADGLVELPHDKRLIAARLGMTPGEPVARLLLLAHDGGRSAGPPHPPHRRDQAASKLHAGPADRQRRARAQSGECSLSAAGDAAVRGSAPPAPSAIAPRTDCCASFETRSKRSLLRGWPKMNALPSMHYLPHVVIPAKAGIHRRP